MTSVSFRTVDQSSQDLHVLIVEKILGELDRNALIVADDYEYATNLWYYRIGEGLGQRNIYALPDFDPCAEEIRKYLKGEEGMDNWQQRITIPPGLPVYTLWKIASILEREGLQIEETGSKNLYKVTIPEQDR